MIAIVTAAAILMAVTPVGELLKVPHLIAQFLEHSEENGGTFNGYLEHHYTHSPASHQDPHHDKGCLPFQHGERTASTTSLVSIDRPYEQSALAANKSESVVLVALVAEEDLPSVALGSIFHPPRM